MRRTPHSQYVAQLGETWLRGMTLSTGLNSDYVHLHIAVSCGSQVTVMEDTLEACEARLRTLSAEAWSLYGTLLYEAGYRPIIAPAPPRAIVEAVHRYYAAHPPREPDAVQLSFL